MKTISALPENDIRHSDRRHPVDFLEPIPTPEDHLQRICEVLSRTFGWVAEADTVEQKGLRAPWFCTAFGPIYSALLPLNNWAQRLAPCRPWWTNWSPISAIASGGKMSAATQKAADQVRGIPLGELLDWHGFKITKEGASIRARNKHYNIVVTGSRWFDNKAGIGAGAIDLQMRLCGGDFRPPIMFWPWDFGRRLQD